MNYYQILGIDNKATKNDIKRAYRKKAVEFHPDVNKSPSASEMFKRIKIAYDNLYDDILRMVYDRSLLNIINSRDIYTQVYKASPRAAYQAPPVIVKPRNVTIKGVFFSDVQRKPDSFSDIVYSFNLNIKNIDLTNCHIYPIVRVKGILISEDKRFQFVIKCSEHKGSFWLEIIDLETDYVICQILKLNLSKIKYGAKIRVPNINRSLINFLDNIFMEG